MKHAKKGTLKALLALLLTALVLTACPNPAGPTETTITLLDIPGVTAPVTGAEAANSAIDTEQYTGTVSWGTLVSRSFEASTEYTAIIELTAKEGYTFKGIAADSFSVAGATITNKANSGTVLASFPATAAVPISTLAIPGITVPAFGASPVRSIDIDQYSGSVAWSPEVAEGANYAASTAYTATITLTAKTGYTASGLAANSFSVAGASSVSHAANSGVITAEFAATGAPGDTVVTFQKAEQSGGASGASTTSSLTLIFDSDPVGLSVDSITLTGATKAALSGSGATRILTISAISVADGETVTVAIANYTGYTISGSPKTAVVYKGASTISLLAVPGVAVPTRAVTYTATTIDTDQYLGVISWSPTISGSFANEQTYTATITLGAKTGYTLSGVSANTFSVASASTVTHAAGSGVITAIFPETAKEQISMTAIPQIAQPITGMTPVSTIDTSQYSGTVSWSPAPSGGVFVVDEAYTATISLTRKHGYTFAGIAADTCTVAGAEAVTHPVGSDTLTVTAVYPTSSLHYYSSNIGILRYVTAGSFQRNSDPANISIITQPYRMGQHEITREQFMAVMGTDPSATDYSSGTSAPVQRVNWYHAIAFCNKLSLAEGLPPVYSVSVGGTPIDWDALTYAQIPIADNADWNGATATWANNGYRLPTEMEWIWAAMGATEDRSNGYTGTGVNTTGYTKGYAGSTEVGGAQVNIGNYAWYDLNSGGNITKPVGGKTANELGLYDMSGNVWEWNWDWDSYPTGELSDYRGAAAGTNRVLPSGSVFDSATYCLVAVKFFGSTPSSQSASFGFRVVRP